MGCGASSGAGGGHIEVVDESYGQRSSRDEERPSRMGRKGKVQLGMMEQNRNSPATLGKKKIQNSFVVQKARNKARHRDFGHTRTYAENDEFTQGSGMSFSLPAENVAIDEAMSVSRSAPSMKMPKQKRGPPKSRFAPAESPSAASVPMSDEQPNSPPAVDATGEAPEKSDKEFKQMLFSSNIAEVLAAATHYREMLSTLNPPVAEVRAQAIVPRLIELVSLHHEREIQNEVVWTLTNICSAEHEDCQEVVDMGALPVFIGLLKSCEDLDVLEQAIWALGNIAADSPELQKLVLDEGVVQPLMDILAKYSEQVTILRHSAWLLSNLCRPRPQSDDLYDILPNLQAVLSTCEDVEVCTHTLWALAYISGDEEALEEAAALEPILPKLVEWVSSHSTSATTPSLRILGNMCSGSTDSTELVVQKGGVQAIMDCLKASSRESVKKECVWSLSNIAAGTNAQVSVLLEAGVFETVSSMMSSADESLQRECAYVLANPWAASVKASPSICEAMMQQGAIQSLGWLLANSSASALLVVALEGLTDAVKKGKFLALSSKPDPGTESEDAMAGPPPAGNPVIKILLETAGLSAKLDELQGVEDEAVQIKVRTFKAAAGI